MGAQVVRDTKCGFYRKHYNPSFLEKDHPDKDTGEGSKPMEPKGKEVQEEVD